MYAATNQTRPVKPRQPSETLDSFLFDLRKHVWSHATDTYRDYVRAVKEEDRLFARAMQLAVPGLNAFREAKEESIMRVVDVAVRQATSELHKQMQQRIDELRAKYVTPLDEYKERLERHDWFYSYSDDNLVWRAGLASQYKLILEAANRPEEDRQQWIDAFKNAWAVSYERELDWEKTLAAARTAPTE